MKAEVAFPGMLIVDSYPFSLGGTAKQAEALKRTGVDGLAGYLNVITRERVQMLFDVGLRFVPVTLAADALKPDRISRGIEALRLADAPGGHVFVDCEGPGIYALGKDNPSKLIDPLNNSYGIIESYKLRSGGYFAPPQPLTSAELFQKLRCTCYWKGMGSIRDRSNALAEPACGWAILQAYHGKKDASGMVWRDLDPSKNGTAWKDTGVFVDPNLVSADFQGRLPVVFAGNT